MSVGVFAIVRDLARLEADARHGNYIRRAQDYDRAALPLRVYLTAAENEAATEQGRADALATVNENRAGYGLAPLDKLNR